jgi:hypothetical protein
MRTTHRSAADFSPFVAMANNAACAVTDDAPLECEQRTSD